LETKLQWFSLTNAINVPVLIFILCPGRSNFFCGNRYIKADDDDATRLIFDCDGSLAGMQATVRADDYLVFE